MFIAANRKHLSHKWVKNRYFLQGFVEMTYEMRVLRLSNQVGSKTTDIKIVSDKIIDLTNLTILYLVEDIATSLQTVLSFHAKSQ
jgi:hypothetical protein